MHLFQHKAQADHLCPRNDQVQQILQGIWTYRYVEATAASRLARQASLLSQVSKAGVGPRKSVKLLYCHLWGYNHLEFTTDQSELPTLRQCYVSDIMEYRYLAEL